MDTVSDPLKVVPQSGVREVWDGNADALHPTVRRAGVCHCSIDDERDVLPGDQRLVHGGLRTAQEQAGCDLCHRHGPAGRVTTVSQSELSYSHIRF